jgi:hypothetical protein
MFSSSWVLGLALFSHAGCKGHITPRGAGVATGPVNFVVSALRRLDWTCAGGRWEIGPFAHTCASVLAWVSRWARRSLSVVVLGHDWSPVSSNKARGCCCRTPGGYRAPLQPRRAARRYLRTRGTSRADFRRSGVGLAPGPQALPMPATALVLYMKRAACFSERGAP